MVGEAAVQSPRHVWLELDRLGIPAAVAGGLALSAWKYVRATREIERTVEQQQELREIRDKFQRKQPSLKELQQSGDVSEVVTQVLLKGSTSMFWQCSRLSRGTEKRRA